jgi:hypothetical protein
MKKEDLINIIINKSGGSDEEELIEKTKSSRKEIIFDKNKLNKKTVLAMANDNLYLNN